jgi:tetratricopeptide (TPR) repeat protein
MTSRATSRGRFALASESESRYQKDVSGDDNNLGKLQVPSDDAPDSAFMKKFEGALGIWAEATEGDNAEAAQAATMELLALTLELQLKNPNPDVRLMNEAGDLESKGCWSEAEAVRRKVLALEESSGNFGMIAKAQMDLCRSLLQVGQGEEAWQLAGAATVSARRKNIIPLIVMALLNEALCALAMEDPGRALAAVSEALQLIEPGKLQANMRARALTARARCLLATGDPAGAEEDLASAWELLPANPGLMMPGPIWTLANWWEARSRLEHRLGNDFRAREAITLAIEHRRHAEGAHALLALARSLELLGEISRAGGDLAAEEQALHEAKSIREGLHIPDGN